MVEQKWVEYKMSTLGGGYDNTPFSLGIEGEQWKPELPGLVIPTGEYTKAGMQLSIAVVHGSDGYGVVSQSKWHHTDDLLMAASIVRTMLEGVDSG